MFNSKPSRRSLVSGFSRFGVALTLLALALPALSQTPATRGSVDWILVLDTSASMRGAGGTRDIFEGVKNSLGEFIRQAREGDSITLFTYDRDTRPRPTVRIADETDKRDLLRALAEIRADGDRTHTGQALRNALERAGELSRRADAATRTVSIVLFTDGIEDVRGVPNPVSIPSNIELLPENRPFIFFISLGEREHEQQLDEFVQHPALQGRGEVVRDPGAQRLAELDERIRARLEAPPELTISVEPTSLDFGQLEPGETTSRQTLSVTSNLAATARLALADATAGDVSLAEPAEAIELRAGETVAVPVRLLVAANAPDGARSVRLTLTAQATAPPDAAPRAAEITASLEVAHVPLWQRALKWLAIILILLLLAVIGLSLLKGEPPWTIWRNWRERAHLEGELEVLRPAPPQPEDGFINLRQLRRDRAPLRSLVPGGATAEADAELATRVRNGRKQISLTRTQGVVRVNRAEVVTTELYDGDLIELGDARLRFNWIGHERPADADETY